MSMFDEMKDSIARSNEYGAPGHGFQGVRLHGETIISREEAEMMGTEEEFDDKIAQSLAQGITRQGGNY